MATPPSPTTTGILATPYYNVHSDYVSKPTISARELSVSAANTEFGAMDLQLTVL